MQPSESEMKRALLLALGVAVAAPAMAQTDLNAGDLALISYNASNPDVMGFVSMTGFSAGTSFIMTDYGWLTATGTFRFGGEGFIKATATRDFAAGEVFVISSNNTTGVSGAGFTYEWDGTPTSPQYAPSAAGDGTIIFQGTIDDVAQTWSGDLLFAVNAEGTDADSFGWQPTATNSNNSGLPTGLTSGLNAIGFVRLGSGNTEWETEYDNYNYIGTRTGTQLELLASITDRANWIGQDSPVFDIDTTSFDVQAVPEPATMAALGLGLAAIIRRRRKS